MVPRNLQRLLSVLRWTVTGELRVLLLLTLSVLAVWGFLELADEVTEGETLGIDERLVMMLRAPDSPDTALGPPWIAAAGRDITAMGSVAILSLVVLAVVGFLVLQGRYGPALLVLTATVSGQVVSSLLKLFFSRERPDVVPHLSHVATASFPSGHSAMAAVVYLTLGMLLAQMELRARARIFTVGVAVLLTLLVGVSRVYMGVHYPSDVLAGWLVGGCWAMLWAAGYRLWQRRESLLEAAGRGAGERSASTEESASERGG